MRAGALHQPSQPFPGQARNDLDLGKDRAELVHQRRVVSVGVGLPRPSIRTAARWTGHDKTHVTAVRSKWSHTHTTSTEPNGSTNPPGPITTPIQKRHHHAPE
ncbi:hypothetical protein GCM10010532_063200 [Dactylosporangium siamense]|uniref:Uncharacterized protein n=1 Tax=Dactylosporangium siamense TaxID=685454 RepID=A0A919UDA3_9ACTN|nr:hypothetical protein Dsi01nite_044490 [Dactylosporangium siamense]